MPLSNKTKLFTQNLSVIQAFEVDFCVINCVQLLIILFDDGQREIFGLESLSSPKIADVPVKFQVREGLNYRAGNGCEWYVRVEQSTWERLRSYRTRVGTATLDGAIKRMLEMVSIRENTEL
jgi:hypothetical protein